MSDASLERTLERRIGQITRRLTVSPAERTRRFLADAAGLLDDLRRQRKTMPHVPVELVLRLLERLPALRTELDPDDAALREFIAKLASLLLEALLRCDRRSEGGAGIRAGAIRRAFDLWADDDHGWLGLLETTLIEMCAGPGDQSSLEELLRRRAAALPLAFPDDGGVGGGDARRALLRMDRHRVERLLGEILAARGRHEFSILVARRHFERTGDALDLVRALARAGEEKEAIRIARREVRNPGGRHNSLIQDELDRLLLRQGQERHAVRALEDAFLAKPSRSLFEALKTRMSPPHWARRRAFLLGHLERHRREPTLVFELYLAEGSVVEADGVAVTQPVAAAHLAAAAASLAAAEPDRAAGWFLIAAHRRAGDRGARAARDVRSWLAEVGRLAALTGQTDAFARELERFRERHRSRRALLRSIADV